MRAVIHYPNEIVIGAGVAAETGDWAAQLCGDLDAPVFVVTDPGVRAAGLVDRVTRSIRNTEVFDQVPGNPDLAAVERGTEQYRQSGARVIVGLGGGSAMDVAKAIRLTATHARPLLDFEDGTGGEKHVVHPLPPMIAVATTAGTGSEVGRAAVIVIPPVQRKVVVFAPQLLPDVALLDPELTVGLPPRLTAATGLDAFTHCVEAFLATGYHPVADGIALRGAGLVARALPRCLDEPADVAARTDLLVAASMGAMAFQKGLGACHSLAHPVSAEVGGNHGHLNAICLPHVLRFNGDVAAVRLEELARAVGVRDGAEGLGDLVVRLARRGGLETRLRDIGVMRDRLGHIADGAVADTCHATNPRPCSAPDFRQLLEDAW